MFSEWQRSWSSCRWPERAIFTITRVSDYTEATNYFIGNGAEHFDASTANSLSDIKNIVRFRQNAVSGKCNALFTQPRPKVDILVIVFIQPSRTRIYTSPWR